MNGTVAKMLSPEEQTLLSNLKAIIQQLESLQGSDSGEGDSSNEIMDALKKLAAAGALGENTESMSDGEDANKSADIKKEDNGPTINENAEARVDNQTDNNDSAASEIGKALLQMLSKNNNVKKSASNVDADIISNAVAKALKPVTEKLQQVETFNSNILEVLGYSEKIEKSIKGTQGVQKGLTNSQNTPVQSLDATGVVNALVDVIKSQGANKSQIEDNNDWNGMQKARKSLASAMPFIFSK